MRIRMGIVQDPKTKKWYFRESIPTALISTYCEYTGIKAKRPEYKRRFNTANRKDAEQLGHAEKVKFDKLISLLKVRAIASPEELRQIKLFLIGGGLLLGNDLRKRVDLELVQGLQERVESELKRTRATREASGNDAVIKPAFKRPAMEAIKYQHYLQNAARILRNCELVIRGELESSLLAEMDRTQKLQEDGQLDYGDRLLANLKSGLKKLPSPKIGESKAPLLSAALEIWQKKAAPDKNTLKEWQLAVKRFNELVGDDLPIDQITSEQMVQYREALSQLPARLSPKYHNVPLPKLIDMAKAGKFLGKPPLKAGSVKKHFVALSSILSVMIDDGYIKENVAARKAPRGKDSNRRAYAIEELQQLFHSRLYRANYRKQPEQEKTARFWLPLISLYSGARATEIAQMDIADICKGDGFWYFSINDYGSDKSLKTQGSRRTVPIHDTLIKCGLLEYAEKVKASGRQKLFTGTSDFSAWYGKYCNSIGLKDSQTVFHSFRHSFKQACREADIQEEIHDMLTGHTGGKSVGRGYGSVSLKKLNEYLQRVEYGGLDIRQLYRDN